MSADKLVYMANQIATFFKSQPGDDQVTRIASHLRDFWEPRMIEEICARARTAGHGLDDQAFAAVALLRPATTTP